MNPSTGDETGASSTGSGGHTSEGEGSTGLPSEGSDGCETRCETPLIASLMPSPDELLYTRLPLVINFAESVVPSTVTSSSLRIIRGETPIAGVVESGPDGATFTPEEPWPLAGAFHIQLTSAITTGDGAAIMPETAILQLPDGQWSLTEINPEGSAPSLSVAPNGRAAMATTIDDSNPPEVYVTRFDPTDGWSGLDQVSDTDQTPLASLPSIATNDLGQVLVAWQFFDGVYDNSYIPANGWSGQGTLDGSGYSPYAALGSGGNGVVIFDANRQTRQVASTRFAIPRVGSTTSFLSDTDQNSSELEVASAYGDSVAAVWVQSGQVWGSRDSAGRVAVSPAGDPSQPTVAVGLNGVIAAAWMELGAGTQVWVNRSASGSVWATAEPVSDIAATVDAPVVAVDALGRTWVGWQQPMGSSTWFMVTQFTPGEGWSTPIPISGGGIESVRNNTIVVDAAGHGMAVWSQPTAGTEVYDQLWAARYLEHEQQWSEPVMVETFDAQLSSLRMGADRLGRFMVGFASDGLQVARFE